VCKKGKNLYQSYFIINIQIILKENEPQLQAYKNPIKIFENKKSIRKI